MIKGLVLAGGFPQIELINKLHARGVYVLLADYNKEPVARHYADEYFQVSTLDIEAVKKVAIENEVDFLITVCTDQALNTVAYVSEELGLPCYINYHTGLNVTNKVFMKKIFLENAIPTARYQIMNEFDIEIIKELQYPLIVKPVDCNSSKGVKRIDSPDELNAAFMDAICYSRTNTVLIEEFMEGRELSVDIYVEDGKVNILCITQIDKIASKDKFIIFRGVYPAEISTDIIEQIWQTAQKVANAFALKNSPMLMQVITDGNKIRVLEFSARTGGGVKYLQIKKVTGFDVIDAVIDLTMGKKPHYEKRNTEIKYLMNEFIYCKEGVFDRLAGFDELINKDLISDYYLFKSRGTKFGEINSSGDRVAGFTILAENKAELIKKHNKVAGSIRILDKDGIDIMHHELLSKLEI